MLKSRKQKMNFFPTFFYKENPMLKSRKQKMNFYSFNLNKNKGGRMSLKKRMNACFKSILSFKHQIEREKTDNQWSISKFIVTLLAFIMGVAVFLGSPAVAAEKKMVKDPTTGKMVTEPEYGGTITYPYISKGVTTDPFDGGYAAWHVESVNEKLAWADWGIDRDVYDFSLYFSWRGPALTGWLAESWEQPDATTIIFHIRKGVYWHDKPPVSGRELTADDVVYTFQRLLVLGDFTERPPQTGNLITLPWESIEATDKYTVVFKLKEPFLGALTAIFAEGQAWILPPEVIEQYGNYADWRNMVGTGALMATDYVEDVSKTYVRNPDYWGFDPKYPENRLPYIDQLRALYMPEEAARVSALRTGKVDIVHAGGGGTTLVNRDLVTSLQRTNPEVQVTTVFSRAINSFNLNTHEPPFDDVRVRHAMQMAIDLETINDTYFGGLAKWEPMGYIGNAFPGYYTPFAEWPEEVKQYYRYDPEGAEKLLDEAGYPRGADGIRFKATHDHRYPNYDLGYAEIAAGYWAEIGVEVTIQKYDTATWVGRVADRNYEIASGDLGFNHSPSAWVAGYPSYRSENPFHREHLGGIETPELTAYYDAFFAATTEEEQKRVLIESDMHIIEQHYQIWTPMAPIYNLNQPWLKGFNGELDMAQSMLHSVFIHLWIDQDLKEEMGF